MLDAFDWFTANYLTVIEALGAILLGCTLLAKLTPTQKDDAFLLRMAQYLSLLNPKGIPGAKLPLTAPKDGRDRR